MGDAPDAAARALPGPGEAVTERALVRLAGGLFVAGFVLFVVVTQFHPSGDEDNHPVIFDKYARSDPWIAVHFGQSAGLLIALGGLLVLHRAIESRGEVPLLAKFAFGATVVTATLFVALQAVDGVTLKYAVDAWRDASGTEKELRFADAETVRWTEWALQSYFRLLLGLTLVLFGVAIARTAIVFRWLGWLAVLVGVLYGATGVAVAYEGLETPGDLVIQLLLLAFAVGLLVAGVRGEPHPTRTPADSRPI